MSGALRDFDSYMQTLSRRGIHSGLDRMQQAAQILDHPQRRYKTVHVAGTNGKGSTCYFLAQMLAGSRYRVGLTLSPHVFDFAERIQCTGPSDAILRPIDPDALAALHNHLQQKLPVDLELSYFEYTTLLAFEHFARQRVDIAVIETGLGGRWDATNVCESLVTAITTIGLDHTALLGPTRETILREKLEIIKGTPHFLFGPDDPNLLLIAKAHAGLCGARFHRPHDFAGTTPAEPAVLCGYLKNNWRFAVALARILQWTGLPIENSVFESTADLQILPARLQILSREPLILLDGAHNAEGLVALKSFLDKEFQEGYDIVFGCLADRDFGELARIIRGPHENYWARFAAPDRVTPADTYECVAKDLGGCIISIDEDFLEFFANQPHYRPTVVCGSFYLCSAFAVAWKNLSRSGKIL